MSVKLDALADLTIILDQASVEWKQKYAEVIDLVMTGIESRIPKKRADESIESYLSTGDNFALLTVCVAFEELKDCVLSDGDPREAIRTLAELEEYWRYE